MVKQGLYLANGKIKKFRNGQCVAIHINTVTEDAFIKTLPLSLLKTSMNNPHIYYSLSNYY